MRVLIHLGHAGHIRNFESAIRLLAERGHTTVLVADRIVGHSGGTANEPLDSLAAELGDRLRFVVQRMPGWHPLSAPGVVLRGSQDYLRYLEPPYDQADVVRERAAASAWVSRGRHGTPRLLRDPRARRRLSASLRALERRLPGRPRVRALLAAERPDVLVVTPLVELRSRQVEWFRAATAAAVPTVFPVSSWDNLTMKGTLHHSPDLVTVWNEWQRQEAIDLHRVPTETVTVTGAVAYDYLFDMAPSSDRDAFCRKVGLRADRPFVTYLCSSPFIARAEQAFTVEWAGHVRSSQLLREVGVLVRPHPHAEFSPEERAALESIEGVRLFPHTATNPVDRASRADYFDSIHFSAAVAGVNTSGFIESSILGRPGFTLLAERYRDTQERLLHFRYLLEANGGPVRTARTFHEHARHLARAIERHDERGTELRTFVERFVRPFGLDQPAAPRLVDAIEGLATGAAR